MARQVGPIKITGTIGDLSFYKSGDDYLVRMKGGPSKKKIMSSPSFVRTRENISEFGACSQAGALLRKGLNGLLPLKDSYVYRRMTQLMGRIKNYDRTSLRGERSVDEGLKQAEAKQLLYDFSFTANPLNTVLIKTPLITDKHELLVDTDALVFPNGCDYVVIKAVLLHPDFKKQTLERFSFTEGLVFAGEQGAKLRLKPENPSTNYALNFYFLQLNFFTKDGNPLQHGALDNLGCIGVNLKLTKENKIVALEGCQRLLIPVNRRREKKIFSLDEKENLVWSYAPV